MRVLPTEYLLKGVYLGLVLFAALHLGTIPPEADTQVQGALLRVNLATLAGLGLVLLIVAPLEVGLADQLRRIPLFVVFALVGAAGMLFEGLLLLRRRVTLELLVACASIVTYLYSAGATLLWPLARDPPRTLLFHASVILIAAWTGIQWRRLARLAPTPDQQQQQQLP